MAKKEDDPRRFLHPETIARITRLDLRARQIVEGFISGGGLVLVHDESLLAIVDDWVTGVEAEAFTNALPVLRRTFSTFAPAERRQIGERVRRGARAAALTDTEDDLDHERASLVLPVLAQILGVADE